MMIAKLKTLISNVIILLAKCQTMKREIAEAEKLIDETLEKFRAEPTE